MILDTLNFIAEAFAFIYLGISGFQVMHLIKNINFHPIMIVCTVFSLAIVRVISVALPTFLTLCNRKIRLGNPEIAMIWYGGLARGAVAFALSFSIKTKHAEDLRIIILLITL